MIVSIVMALGWGAFFGYRHDGVVAVGIGALVAAAICFWLNRDGFKPQGDRLDRWLLFAAIYGALAVAGVALSGSAYALAAWLHR
jgi:hypothetical protein